MRVFVTGATGWVGNVVVDDFLGAGHQVLGLSRSKEKAASLAAKGATVLQATLDDLDQLAAAAGDADAVVHLAFNHDFSKYAENSEQDRRAIMAMGNALAGTDKPMLVTTGLAMLAPGRIATEADTPPLNDPNYVRKSEAAAAALAARGVRVGAVRRATTVHGIGDPAFMAMLARLARATGVSGYIGDGAGRWPAVHVSDAGRLYRLVLDAGVPLSAYHAVAEEGVAFRDIAEAIGRALGLPVQSRPPEHFGALAGFVGTNAPVSSTRTRELTGWTPTGPTLLADLTEKTYFAPSA
ncbi:SDR family oxidoreductase [Sphingomonas bacterium]|uniref:SDR family oxidoreductase n=1 Tax=Sphingomonas bacterium TaxID=1895847 RepID=UPI0015759351|nr:SDR family oxidoreductase [Sphingomonas bacterium]